MSGLCDHYAIHFHLASFDQIHGIPAGADTTVGDVLIQWHLLIRFLLYRDLRSYRRRIQLFVLLFFPGLYLLVKLFLEFSFFLAQLLFLGAAFFFSALKKLF